MVKTGPDTINGQSFVLVPFAAPERTGRAYTGPAGGVTMHVVMSTAVLSSAVLRTALLNTPLVGFELP